MARASLGEWGQVQEETNFHWHKSSTAQEWWYPTFSWESLGGGGAQERFFWYISRYFTAGRSMQGCVHNEALGLWLTAMIFHAKIVIILVGVFWPSDYYEYIGEYFWPSSAPCLQMQNPSSSYDSPLVTLEVILGAEMFCCLRHEMYCLLFQHANELASISGHVTNPRPAYSWSLNTGHNRLLYKHVRGVFFDGKSE